MVSPYYILSIGLGLAFILGLFGKKFNKLNTALIAVALLSFVAISASWLWQFIAGNAETSLFYSAGFKPPFSIALQLGLQEAIISLMVNVAGFFSVIYLWKRLTDKSNKLGSVLLILFMGLNMLILTRDLFNIFVFLEITAIAVGGIIFLEDKKHAVSAGLKYLLASSLISAIYLLGAVLVYFSTGSLYINDFALLGTEAAPMAAAAVFLTLIAIIFELKPFPANGWALDVYQGSHPAIGAIISAGVATTMLFVLHKLMFMANPLMTEMLVIIGLITFLFSNLLGISQKNANRLLGYSSIGQMGLIISIIGMQPFLGDKFTFIAIAVLVSHFLAKAGLFWLSGIIKEEKIKNWSNLRKKPFLLVLFGTFIFLLIGFPPFPSFFGKWELIMQLSSSNHFLFVVLILIGSFFEGIYLFRWLGYAVKSENEELTKFTVPINKIIPVAIFGILAYVLGYYSSTFIKEIEFATFIPLLFIALIFLLDFIPAFVKNTLSILALSYYSYLVLPGLYENDLLRFIFFSIFILGGILTLIAGYHYKGKRKGFYPAALLMFAGLAGIIEAETLLQFFFSWELMTLGSYVLIIRGKKSMKHAFSYMLFSIGGAYLILAAFGLVSVNAGLSLAALNSITLNANLIYALLVIGFMTKTASLGLHIWLPGAHAEAESDVSPMVSAILLKAGVFGLLITFIAMGSEQAGGSNILYLLGWLGAITALVGNLAASFQEDAKKLLAYSSIGQLGYILFAFAMLTHIGWLGGFTYVINHFIFKAILFLTIGGIVLRVSTHNMYEMGGLIKKMPFSFIAVLIGIITLSGVPPLSGFAGKWLFYNAVLLKGWYFQGAIVFFAGIIAFLYCFRLIYAIFLGQLKDNHRNVKEISIWFLIPIYILIVGIMIFSAKPELILQPIGDLLITYFPSDVLTWTGTTASTSLGYWNGSWIMIIVGIMFAIILAWLIIFNRKAKKVKQFNIVYSGERPFKPETTHMAHNLYAGYNKALGFIIAPYVTGFWNWSSNFIHDISGFIRRIYSGNGQTYLLHIIMYITIIYFVMFK